MGRNRTFSMLIKNAFNPVFSLLARACERSEPAAEFIRSLDFRGKGCIVERIRSDAMTREVTTACDGVRYRLDLRDDVQREIYFNIFERRELKCALELIPAGGICIDVGANNGAFALQFARTVGPNGIVHAFEPDAEIFARLQTNCRLNGFEAFLKCHQLAVSNVTASLTFHRSDPRHSGWGSLEEFQDIASQRETVESITLDDFVNREAIRRVDFLKVDIEAHEPELLEGARDSLRNRVFRYLMIEFNGIRLNERGKSLEEFLAPILGNGYTSVGFRKPGLEDLRNTTIAPESVCTSLLFSAQN